MKGLRNYAWSKLLFYIGGTLVVVQLGLLYKWNWFCTDLDARRHVSKMCDLYKKGDADGTVCMAMCETQEIHDLSCYRYHMTKETVFGGTWGGTKIVFKSADPNLPAIHWYDNDVLKYPTEREFFSTVRAVSKSILNQSLPEDTINKLAHLWPKHKHHLAKNRNTEMDNVWILIQDSEYLLASAFWDRDIFPQVVGTCGPYFGVQYLEAIPETFSILYDKDTKENWGMNLRYSVMLMELVEELDNNFKEPFYVCDMKLRDFGVTHVENGRAKLMDLDTVHPKSIVNKILESIEGCEEDRDCKFFDCRGRCNKEMKRCKGVSNNNLQILCEKIFLGWRMSNTILLPGLLLSQYAPAELMVILRHCANPEGESAVPRGSTSEETRKHMYNILVEVEQTVNTETFI